MPGPAAGLASTAGASTRTVGLRAPRLCYGVAVVLVVSGLVSTGVGLALGWGGLGSWRTAADFGVGFGLVLGAVSYTATRLALGPRARAVLLGGLAVACAVEVVAATVQAWRGEAFFFAATGPLAELLFAGAPAFAGAVIVAVAVGLVVAAARPNHGRPPGMTLAVRAGAASFLAADLIGVAMIVAGARAKAAVGAPATTLATQEATQASMRLLPAHLTALAGILLPLLAGLAVRTTFSRPRQTQLIVLACSGYLTAAAAIVVHNLLGLATTTPIAIVVAAVGATTLLAAAAGVALGLIQQPSHSPIRG